MTASLDHRAATFQQLRPRLYGIAYRMLGSRADAEDMVQDAYLRWHRSDLDRVQTPQAWLTTTVTRLCIDRLRAARVERDAYFGPWLPEPLVGDGFAAPDRGSELASDLSVAFLVVLQRLAPDERAGLIIRRLPLDTEASVQIFGRVVLDRRGRAVVERYAYFLVLDGKGGRRGRERAPGDQPRGEDRRHDPLRGCRQRLTGSARQRVDHEPSHGRGHPSTASRGIDGSAAVRWSRAVDRERGPPRSASPIR